MSKKVFRVLQPGSSDKGRVVVEAPIEFYPGHVVKLPEELHSNNSDLYHETQEFKKNKMLFCSFNVCAMCVGCCCFMFLCCFFLCVFAFLMIITKMELGVAESIDFLTSKLNLTSYLMSFVCLTKYCT